MAIFCIDDGGDGTQTDTTQTAGTLDWSKADVSIAALIATYATALTTSGNIIYFGSDTSQTQASALLITGPTSGAPVQFISADITNATPTYLVASADQLITTGANAITFDGAFGLVGLQCNSGSTIELIPDVNEGFYTKDCTFKPAHNSYVNSGANGLTCLYHKNLTISGANDTGAAASDILRSSAARTEIEGLTFASVSNRTTIVIYGSASGTLIIAGVDCTGFPNTTAISGIRNNLTSITNARFQPSYVMSVNVGGWNEPGCLMMTNFGAAAAPEAMYLKTSKILCVSTPDIYRTGGCAVESVPVSWLITTDSVVSPVTELSPGYTPWMYGTVSTTGAKTFDLYITNDTADFDDSQVWLEVEYLATADEAQWSLATDQRATITTTPAAQTDDTASTWNGAGPSYTYKQKLSVAATIGETGQYRARVAVGVASIASSRYFYVDPKVTVS